VHATPRYFPGRLVFIRTHHSVTRLATIVSCARASASVDVQPLGESSSITVSLVDLMLWNHGQELPAAAVRGQTCVQLEDGIWCDYARPATRAKMCEIAVALSPWVAQLNFDGPAAECVRLQRQCLLSIRHCLDLITFQRDALGQLTSDGTRVRDGARYCKDDAALFAIHGQGHCHTVSSVMAAFTYPWCALLGLELKYRGGGHSPIHDAGTPELHQWLEFTLRPSGQTFTCDLYRADATDDRDQQDALLNFPLEESVCALSLYPHGRLLVLSGCAMRLTSSHDDDIAEKQ
jgi:hypothetical protein